jgi:hypothetical protein
MTTILPPQAILDFENELDVNMLDRVIETFYTGAGTEVCRLQQHNNLHFHDVHTTLYMQNIFFYHRTFILCNASPFQP